MERFGSDREEETLGTEGEHMCPRADWMGGMEACSRTAWESSVRTVAWEDLGMAVW